MVGDTDSIEMSECEEFLLGQTQLPLISPVEVAFISFNRPLLRVA